MDWKMILNTNLHFPMRRKSFKIKEEIFNKTSRWKMIEGDLWLVFESVLSLSILSIYFIEGISRNVLENGLKVKFLRENWKSFPNLSIRRFLSNFDSFLIFLEGFFKVFNKFEHIFDTIMFFQTFTDCVSDD